MVIVATANINGLGLPAAVHGSACSSLKGSGSKQDPKRTDGASERASDDSTQPVTPFEESLHSTIKDQESVQQRQNTGTAGKRTENNHKTRNQHQAKSNVSSTRDQPAGDKAVSGSAAKNDATQNQQQPDVQQTASTSADANAAVAAPGAMLTAFVNLLQSSGSTENASTTPDSSMVSAAVSDSKPAAIKGAAAASPVNLDSQIQGLKGDQDTLVFDGTLHPAAPVTITPPQGALPGAGKPAWLLNAQPAYTPEAPANPAAGLPDQPRGAASTSDSSSKIPTETGIPHPAVAPVAPGSASSDGNPAPPKKVADNAGQTTESPSTNVNQQKPAAGPPAQEKTASPIPAEPSGQAGSDQSSSGNTSGFENDPKRGTSSRGPVHSPEIRANGPSIFPTSDSGIQVVQTAAPSNNAAAASSKSAPLPIDQQADTRQPSMKTDLNMRIQGQSGESINLRISERGGDIQISVRSSDQSTASVLKHELPSLEAGLERAGWHMDNGGTSQSGQDQREARRDSQNPDRNRDQNAQSSNWQERNQRRKDSSPDTWFELDQ